MYGWFENDSHIYLAMEYIPHGDLGKFLTKTFSEDEARLITSQLIEGLVFMHENNFVHRDLKPAVRMSP
jgi:serine/threonine protein kinase